MNSFYYIPYQLIAASSESPDSNVDELSAASLKVFEPLVPPIHGGWENARFCTWPQEVIIRLETRAQVQHILIASKENRSIPECEFYIGDGLSGNFTDCQYRYAGSGSNVIEAQPRQFNIYGIGNFIKIVFTKQPAREIRNSSGQVALGILKIYGQQIPFEINLANNQQPILRDQNTDEVDRILLEMGVPLIQESLDWDFNENSDLNNAPIDQDTRQTLKDIQRQWLQANELKDYEKISSIRRDMKILFKVGNQILNLKRALQNAVSKEDFVEAIEIRNQLQQQEQKRECFDLMYETSRFQEMVALGEPSEKFKEIERLNNQKQIDRLNRQQLALRQEREKKQLQDKLAQQKHFETEDSFQDYKHEEPLYSLKDEKSLKISSQATNKSKSKDRKSNDFDEQVIKPKNNVSASKKNSNVTSYQSKKVLEKSPKKLPSQQKLNDQSIKQNDKEELTEGDADLMKYFDPLIKKSNSADVGNLAKDLGNFNRAESDATIKVAGIKVWNSLHSENWRIREAASTAFLNFISDHKNLPLKYKDKTQALFLACADIAKIALQDNLLQISNKGQEILVASLHQSICGGDIPPKTVQNQLKPFMQILIDRACTQTRIPQIQTIQALLKLFQHPHMDIGILVALIIETCQNPPGVVKMPANVIDTKLKIYIEAVMMFSAKNLEWDLFFEYVIVDAFNHPNAEVRQTAALLCQILYKQIGPELRKLFAVVAQNKIKQTILNALNKEFDKIDQSNETKTNISNKK